MKCTTDLPATARTVAASENPHRGEGGRGRHHEGEFVQRMDELVFVLRSQGDGHSYSPSYSPSESSKKKKRPEKMSQNFNRLGDKGKKRPVDAPLVMHVRVWFIGLNLTKSIKWRNIFIAQSQIAKHTHRKLMGAGEECHSISAKTTRTQPPTPTST